MNKEELRKELESIESRKSAIEKMLKNKKGYFKTDTISLTLHFKDEEIILDEITQEDIEYTSNKEIIMSIMNGCINNDLLELFKKGERKCSAIYKYKMEDIEDNQYTFEEKYDCLIIDRIYLKQPEKMIIPSFAIDFKIYQ